MSVSWKDKFLIEFELEIECIDQQGIETVKINENPELKIQKLKIWVRVTVFKKTAKSTN